MADGASGTSQDGNFSVTCRDITDHGQMVQNQVNFFAEVPRRQDRAAARLGRIEEITARELDSSCRHGYVETKALKACMKIMEGKGACFIVGWAGTGKTALGHEVLRRHRDTALPLLLHKPEDWELVHGLLSQDKPVLVFFDDIFSDYNPRTTLSPWKEVFRNLWLEVKSGKVKVLMSFRGNALPLVTAFFDRAGLFKYVPVVSLDENPPSDKEKVSIFRNMLTASPLAPHLSPYEIKKAARQPNALGFPGCCELYCSTRRNVALSCYIVQLREEGAGHKSKSTKTKEDDSVWENFKSLAKELVLETLEAAPKLAEIVERVDETVRDWNYFLDTQDNTVLHYVVDQGGAEASLTAVLSHAKVQQFISCQNSSGQTALHRAVLRKLPRAAELLLQHGCDASLWDGSGRTASHYAVDHTRLDMLQTLQKHSGLTLLASPKDGVTPLHVAASNNNAEAVKFLLEAGDDVNAGDAEGSTLLHHAARVQASQALAAVKGREGVEVDRRNQAGRTALAEAAFLHSEVTQILLDMGADETIADEEGNTPLLIAIAAGNSETAQQLLKRNTSILLTNSAGDSPLLLALRLGMAGTARALMKRQGDLDVADAAGNTPLMLAAKSGDLDLVQWMLSSTDCALTLGVQNQGGETVLEIARGLEDDSMAESIAQLGREMGFYQSG